MRDILAEIQVFLNYVELNARYELRLSSDSRSSFKIGTASN